MKRITKEVATEIAEKYGSSEFTAAFLKEKKEGYVFTLTYDVPPSDHPICIGLPVICIVNGETGKITCPYDEE